jgi:hypothetical protein
MKLAWGSTVVLLIEWLWLLVAVCRAFSWFGVLVVVVVSGMVVSCQIGAILCRNTVASIGLGSLFAIVACLGIISRIAFARITRREDEDPNEMRDELIMWVLFASWLFVGVAMLRWGSKCGRHG